MLASEKWPVSALKIFGMAPQFSRTLSSIGTEVLRVRPVVRHAVRDDELVLGDRSLCVEGLHEGALADHDPALCVREVALRRVPRLARGRHGHPMQRELRLRTVVVIVIVTRRKLLRLLLRLCGERRRCLLLARRAGGVVELRAQLRSILAQRCGANFGGLLELRHRLANAWEPRLALLDSAGTPSRLLSPPNSVSLAHADDHGRSPLSIPRIGPPRET